jgi:VWFA-related protein
MCPKPGRQLDLYRTITIGVVLTLALSTIALPQEPEFAIRLNVAAVSLESVVLDSNARPVTDLKREDFTIYEDGEPVRIQNFSSVEAPFSILLLFENTPSVYLHRTFLADASNQLMKGLRPQDRVSIYAIELTTRRMLDWRNAQTGKAQEIKVGRPSGELNLYDAIDDVFGKFSGAAGRKGIVVMTTGREAKLFRETLDKGRVPTTDADKDFQKLLRKVQGRGIPLYFVAVNTDPTLEVNPWDLPTGTIPLFLLPRSEYLALKSLPRTPLYKKLKDPSPTVADDFIKEIRSRMELLAEVSGGRIYFPKSTEELVPLYEQIGKELGTSYSFGYAPRDTRSGTTHRIEVRVSDPSLRVIQSRQSYTTR